MTSNVRSSNLFFDRAARENRIEGCARGAKLHRGRSREHRFLRPIRGVLLGPQDRRCRGAVERSGIDVEKTELVGDHLGSGRFARGGRTVDRNHGCATTHAATRSRSFQKPGYDTATQSLSVTTISLPSHLDKTPKAIAIR